MKLIIGLHLIDSKKLTFIKMHTQQTLHNLSHYCHNEVPLSIEIQLFTRLLRKPVRPIRQMIPSHQDYREEE